MQVDDVMSGEDDEGDDAGSVEGVAIDVDDNVEPVLLGVDDVVNADDVDEDLLELIDDDLFFCPVVVEVLSCECVLVVPFGLDDVGVGFDDAVEIGEEDGGWMLSVDFFANCDFDGVLDPLPIPSE